MTSEAKPERLHQRRRGVALDLGYARVRGLEEGVLQQRRGLLEFPRLGQQDADAMASQRRQGWPTQLLGVRETLAGEREAALEVTDRSQRQRTRQLGPNLLDLLAPLHRWR